MRSGLVRRPAPDRRGHELGTVTRPDEAGYTREEEQLGQPLEDVPRGELAVDPDQQAFPGVLVQDVQDPERPAVIRAVMHEVVRPDVGPMGGPQPHARAIVQPQPPLLRLFLRNLEPLASPQALHPLGVHLPAGIPQQGRDPAIPVAAILPRQLDQLGHQARLVGPAARHVPLRRAVLAQPCST